MSQAPYPTISIITPCLNRADTIARCIESVLAQEYPAIQHIIVDGGSTDGTLAILKQYPHVHVLSEPDRNLYDAINKGIRLAVGDAVGFLNSDDLYMPGAFAAAAENFADPAIDMVIGSAEIFTITDGRETVLRRFIVPHGIALDEENVIDNVTLMNASFWRRSFLARCGLFDVRFPLASDKDFWMRLVIERPAHRLLPRLQYRYLSHSGSLTFSGADSRDKLSSHLLALTQARLAECRPGTPSYDAYRRWHAWAVGYRLLSHLRRRQAREAIRTINAGLACDIFWPFRFVLRLPKHWRDRHVRRGFP